MSAGIYRIFNKENNKTYVGKSIDLDKRKYQHFSLLEKGEHDNSDLQNDFSELGIKNFGYEILEEVSDNGKLDYLEDYYIKKFDSLENGYNQCRGNIKSVLKDNSFKIAPSFNQNMCYKDAHAEIQHLILWHNTYFNTSIGLDEFKKIYCHNNTKYFLKTSSSKYVTVDKDDVDDYLYKYKIFVDNIHISDQYCNNDDEVSNRLNELYKEWGKLAKKSANMLKINKLPDNEFYENKINILHNISEIIKATPDWLCEKMSKGFDSEILEYLIKNEDDDYRDIRYYSTEFYGIKETI